MRMAEPMPTQTGRPQTKPNGTSCKSPALRHPRVGRPGLAVFSLKARKPRLRRMLLWKPHRRKDESSIPTPSAGPPILPSFPTKEGVFPPPPARITLILAGVDNVCPEGHYVSQK